MPPTSTDLFGPLDPIPPAQLADDDGIYRKLSAPGSPFETEQRLIGGRVQTVYKTLPASMRDLWQASARDFAQRPYVVFDSERYTYAEVWDKSVRVAAWLAREFQVRKGDRVGIAARNYPEFVVSFWAITLLGGVTTVLNSFHDGETLAFSIRDVGCRVVICDGERYERLHDHLDGLFGQSTPSSSFSSSAAASIAEAQRPAEDGRLSALVVLPWIATQRVNDAAQKPWLRDAADGKNGGVHDFDTLMAQTPSDASRVPNVSILPDDNGCILFTSGTTGRPKGVLSTQRQYLSCLRLATFASARTLMRRNRPLPPPPDPSSMDQSSVLVLVPLTHTTGLQSGLSLATAAGAKIVLMASYNRDAAVKLAQREKVQTILGIGFMVREITLAGVKLPSLSGISHGGSSSAKELAGEISKHHSNAVPSAGYGLTEVNGVAASLQLDDYVARPTSAGKPPIGVELMLVDPQTGARVARGEQGELWIRTPGRAMGYWNRPKESAEAFLADGWFRSGDLAKMDEEGFLYIVDRVKDIIVRGGENISCTHVESAAYGHPSVMDCVAVALPDERLGERVGLVCILKQGASMAATEKDVLNTLRKTLPKYAVPEYIWIRTDPLERNSSGKVLRNVVRQAVLERIKGESSSSSAKAKL